MAPAPCATKIWPIPLPLAPLPPTPRPPHSSQNPDEAPAPAPSPPQGHRPRTRLGSRPTGSTFKYPGKSFQTPATGRRRPPTHTRCVHCPGLACPLPLDVYALSPISPHSTTAHHTSMQHHLPRWATLPQGPLMRKMEGWVLRHPRARRPTLCRPRSRRATVLWSLRVSVAPCPDPPQILDPPRPPPALPNAVRRPHQCSGHVT